MELDISWTSVRICVSIGLARHIPRQTWAPNVGQAAMIHEDLSVFKGGESGRGYSFLLGRAQGKSHWKPGKSPEYWWFSEGKLGSNLKGGFSSFKPCSSLPEWYMNKSTASHHELQWSHASIATPKTPTSLSVCIRQISNCRFIKYL